MIAWSSCHIIILIQYSSSLSHSSLIDHNSYEPGLIRQSISHWLHWTSLWVIESTRLSMQLLWELHIGFPTINIATSLSTLTSWGAYTKVFRATYKNVDFLYNISSVTRQIRIIDPSCSTLPAHPNLLESCAGRVKFHAPAARWNPHDGIRTMKPARVNVHKVTLQRSRKKESVHWRQDLERIQDAIVFLVRIACLLVCSYCGKCIQVISHNRHCDLAIGPNSSSKQFYGVIPWKHRFPVPRTFSLQSRAHSCLFAISDDPIHNDGINTVEFTQYIRTIRSHKAIHARHSAQGHPQETMRTIQSHDISQENSYNAVRTRRFAWGYLTNVTTVTSAMTAIKDYNCHERRKGKLPQKLRWPQASWEPWGPQQLRGP